MTVIREVLKGVLPNVILRLDSVSVKIMSRDRPVTNARFVCLKFTKYAKMTYQIFTLSIKIRVIFAVVTSLK